MVIPEEVRVGSVYYKVELVDKPIILNGRQCLGLCDKYTHEIQLDPSLQDDQSLIQTFYHELAHAMMFERGIDLQVLGLSYDDFENVIDGIGIMMHQVLLDNPDLTLTPEEFDAKYPPEEEDKETTK
nr:MAG TPA: SprT-like family protein [Caudoviricetes sp.]